MSFFMVPPLYFSVLVAPQAAIDGADGARDVSRPRRGEKDREHRQVLRLSISSHGNLVLRLPRAILGRVVAADLVAHDAARADAIDGDALLADLARESLGERGERGLRAEGAVHAVGLLLAGDV